MVMTRDDVRPRETSREPIENPDRVPCDRCATPAAFRMKFSDDHYATRLLCRRCAEGPHPPHALVQLDLEERGIDWRDLAAPDHLDGARSFDPEKCDHGAELMGRTEWQYCENCRPDLLPIFDPAKCSHPEWNDGMVEDERRWCENCRPAIVDPGTVAAVLTPDRLLRQELRRAKKLRR